ncbi:MAG: hypothetical protein DWI48_05215 [Chloroflexi bacterium]|nr:MAG: hypothetical protein DWI48_05215 [Chloroflexota bacterium]
MAVSTVALAASLAMGGLLAVGPSPVEAQQATQAATSKDPGSITFTVRAPGNLKSAKLDYFVRSPNRDNADNFVGGTGDGTVAGADASYVLQANTAQRYIPVGSQFRFHWVLTTDSGSTTTVDSDYLFLDGRYEWKSQSDGQVTVYWYGNNDAAAATALQSSKSSLDDNNKLLEVQVKYPIRLIVYRSEDEGRAAKQPRSSAFDAQVQTGGQRVGPDLILVFANNRDVVRHETAHIVTHVAGDGPFVGVPSWLDEGTAVYAQLDPGPEYRSGLQLGIAADQTLPLTSINSPTSQPSLVNLFYGQSWSVVKFMVDTYGQPKFADLYRTIYAGARIDDALLKVYNLDQDGLYNAWRAKNGLKPVAASPRATAAAAAAVTGTVAPLGVPSGGGVVTGATAVSGDAGGTSSDSGNTASAGPSSGVAIAVLGATVVVALALGGGAFMMMRRK